MALAIIETANLLQRREPRLVFIDRERSFCVLCILDLPEIYSGNRPLQQRWNLQRPLELANLKLMYRRAALNTF